MKTIILEKIWDEKYELVEYPTGNYGLFEDGILLKMVKAKEIKKAIKQGYYDLYGKNATIIAIQN